MTQAPKTDRIEFWFEFASTYSYLSVLRIEELAARHHVRIWWRPFLLGPIFRELGWETSPFNIYPTKGDYMWRDVERRARRYGLGFRSPARGEGIVFPQNGLTAARFAIVGLDRDWGKEFCKSVFTHQFVDAGDISSFDSISKIARKVGASDDEIAMALSPKIKAKLREQTEAAANKGIFGAPSFTIGNELFWGDDRMEDACFPSACMRQIC